MARYFAAAGANVSFDSLTTSIQNASLHTGVLNTHVKELHRVMTQSVKFRAAMEIQNFVMSQAQDAIRWVKDLNQSLVNIQVVTEKTTQQMGAVFDTVIRKSKELTTTAQDYADAQLIFFQQGLGDAEVERRADITLKAARASAQSTETMSEQLTAIWNTYQMQNAELERSASVAAKLGADTAVDFAYIAEAMQPSAVAAAQMGVAYESLAAQIATVGETTMQTSSVIGNGFKTIYSRFEQLRASGTDGEVTLGLVSGQLKDLGINILDASGELRQLDDVIFETGNRWGDFSASSARRWYSSVWYFPCPYEQF